MAENEIIDLGHKSRWVRTRKALQDRECPVDEVVAAMTADIEGLCAGLNAALRNGPPLSGLLRLALGSSLQVQTVIAQFTEKGLAVLVNAARNRCRSNDPAEVAEVASQLLTQRLIDQAGCRAGREERFRDPELHREFLEQATRTFKAYEGDLRAMLEAALRGSAPVSFKRRVTGKRRMTLRQLMNVSLIPSGTKSPSEPKRVR
jgi:hypothetical protein